MSARDWARLAALAGGAALVYSLVEPWRLEVVRHDIFLENLPPEAQGLRIVQISDLHGGAHTPLVLVNRIINAAASENPDLVVLTGDLVSRRNSYSPVTLARLWARPVMEYVYGLAHELKRLRPPLGIWAVPGNHDLWNESFEPIAEALAASGIESLVNRFTRLPNGLVLVGLDDLRAGHPDFQKAFAGVAPGEAQIILNHNPRAVSLLADRNALILSGHTHAGQVRFPSLQIRKFPVDLGRSFYMDGLYRPGKAVLYVSRGAGTVHLPMRLGARPEIAVFTLRGA